MAIVNRVYHGLGRESLVLRANTREARQPFTARLTGILRRLTGIGGQGLARIYGM